MSQICLVTESATVHCIRVSLERLILRIVLLLNWGISVHSEIKFTLKTNFFPQVYSKGMKIPLYWREAMEVLELELTHCMFRVLIKRPM